MNTNIQDLSNILSRAETWNLNQILTGCGHTDSIDFTIEQVMQFLNDPAAIKGSIYGTDAHSRVRKLGKKFGLDLYPPTHLRVPVELLERIQYSLHSYAPTADPEHDELTIILSNA